MDENKGLMNSFMKVMDKMAGPMTSFGNLKAIKAIQNGVSCFCWDYNHWSNLYVIVCFLNS